MAFSVAAEMITEKDPSTEAHDAVAGTIIIDPNGVRWRKIDNGSSTNVVRISDHSVEASTAGSGSPNVLTAAESGSLISNEGATAQNYNTLPPAAAGLEFKFYCQDADGIRITVDGTETIRVGATVSTSGGYVESTTIGSFIHLYAINSSEWVGISAGTWVFST